MTTVVTITVPASMGKPWTLADAQGAHRAVRVRKIDDSATVLFEAGNSRCAVETRVDNAVSNHDKTRWEYWIPAGLLKAMKAYRIHSKTPWHYRIEILVEERRARVSFGDYSLSGDLVSSSQLPRFDAVWDRLKHDAKKLDPTEPRIGFRGSEMVKVLNAMTRITDPTEFFVLPDSGIFSEAIGMRRFMTGAGSRSKAALMPISVEGH